MDKILSDGTVITKAKFWRTTCKQCGKEMPKDIIMNGGKFCNKLCRRNWTSKRHPPKHRYINVSNEIDEQDGNFNNEEDFQNQDRY